MAGLAGGAAPASAARPLLAGAIDYAGLFPPAALPMADALAQYAEYRASGDAWALGRFVLPAGRLREFSEARASIEPPSATSPWSLSVVAGPSAAADWAAVQASALRGDTVDGFEVKAATVGEIRDASNTLPRGLDVFFEIPIDRDPRVLIDAIATAGRHAKVRTGGVTADAFPGAGDLARFIVACAQRKVAFKATAGLHHPLRATYRLTYAADSPHGEMYGFLNMLVAAALADSGEEADAVRGALLETDPARFRLGVDGLVYGSRRLESEALAHTRARLALGFGSCSFREPIDELHALGML